jgi:PPM family protein phosphatase
MLSLLHPKGGAVTAMAGRTALRWGGATNVGRVRSINEDNYLARDDVGLWAVADGMGGHRGGEVASEIACASLGRAFADRTVEGLVDAIEQANAAVFEAGSDDPDLSGMGTTVVALAVVDELGDEVLAVANVGDSRVYRLAGSDLEQLTEDHSLVADLVRQGNLSPEEAAVHPQRNIVTRVLGVNDDVPVDIVTVEPHRGDRYVLCSDGLFNEVPEPAIADVLHRIDEPGAVAEDLVRLAVEGGGRDNVTVVVVDVIDDGGRAEVASAALAGEATAETASGVGGPRRSSAYADGDADNGATATATAPAPVAETAGATGKRDRGPRYSKPSTRRVTWRVVLFTLIVIGLVGGAFATIQWYGRSTYFVGFDGDRVAIYKGRPGGLLWIDPKLEEVTDLERDRVPADSVDDIDAGKEQASLGDANSYVARLQERADELDPETPATTSTTSTTRGRTTTTRAGTTTTTTR